MKPNPFADALHFLVQPAWTTVVYWLLLLGSIAIAVQAWRSIPAQRSWCHIGNWLCRFFVGTMWWQQTLWKLPPLYTDNPSDPLNSALAARGARARNVRLIKLFAISAGVIPKSDERDLMSSRWPRGQLAPLSGARRRCERK